MAMWNSSLFALVKWLNEEDCWDVIPSSDVCKLEDDNVPDNLIGKPRMVKFNNEQHPATILEIGNRKDLEKSCKEQIDKLRESRVEKECTDIRRKTHKRSLDGEEENVKNSKKIENIDLPKRKYRKHDSQQRLLDDLRKKIDTGENGDAGACICEYKEKYEAAKKTIYDLEEKNICLEKELDNYRNSFLVIDKIKDLHKEAKSILKYSKRIANPTCESVTLATVKEEPTAGINVPVPTSSELKSSASQIELVKESGVFIEKRKLDNICADASGDGKKLARNLLMSLYKTEELINHSVTGKQSNAFKHLNLENAKPAICQVKLNAILNFVRNETCTDMSKVKCSISNKLKEVTKFYTKT